MYAYTYVKDLRNKSIGQASHASTHTKQQLEVILYTGCIDTICVRFAPKDLSPSYSQYKYKQNDLSYMMQCIAFVQQWYALIL